MLFILSSSIANPIVEIPLSDIFDDYPQMLHAESTICGHKIMVISSNFIEPKEKNSGRYGYINVHCNDGLNIILHCHKYSNN